MPEIKAVVGKSLHIICPASGYPLDKIIWSKGQTGEKENGKISFHHYISR